MLKTHTVAIQKRGAFSRVYVYVRPGMRPTRLVHRLQAGR